MNHPVANTNNAASCQIIIPATKSSGSQRKNDVYISVVSYAHNVAPKGKYIAIVSSIVETSNPATELASGLALLQPIEESFSWVSDMYEPVSDGSKDKVYISKSFGADTHFGWECSDILDIYRRIMGKDMDLSPPKKEENKSQE